MECPTELTSHSNGALIHYKRNQIHFRFSLTQNALPGGLLPPEKIAYHDIQVTGSNLNAENLHIDFQIVESPHISVATALGDITSGSYFVDRPNNLAGTSSPVQGLALLTSRTQQESDLEERMYFERATSGNGTKGQSYFYILVSLCASNPWTKCALQTWVSVTPLIVRGGNPGSYTSFKKPTERQRPDSGLHSSPNDNLAEASSSPGESPLLIRGEWERRTSPEHGSAILYTKEGCRVGINNNDPHEALSVRGNIEMTGHLMRPSDRRIKQNLRVVDNSEQLKRIREVQLYDYERQDLASGIWVPERGVIAQELAMILEDAVEVRGDIILPSGQTIRDFCTVNERNLMIEHLGATQALANQVERMEATQEGLLMRIIRVNICIVGI